MLEGKVVAVTGAGRGIGREIALLAGREAPMVVVNDVAVGGRRGSRCRPAQEVVDLIRSEGGARVNGGRYFPIGRRSSIVEDAMRA